MSDAPEKEPQTEPIVNPNPEDAGPVDNVAAVDLGSNSFHMIVARANASGEVQVVDRVREMVRLASGLDDAGNLSDDAKARAIQCLEKFGQRIRHLPEGSVRVVGTNTLRRAQNDDEFRNQAEQALGHPVRTISGIEEARLIYLGVAQSLGNPDGRRLVIDIGGGSTEVILGKRKPRLMNSLYLGCVSSSMKFFPDGKIDAKSWTKAVENAAREFEPIQMAYRKLGWSEAVGASGTVRAIHSVLRAEGIIERGITRKSLRRLRDLLLAAGQEDRFDFEGLSPQRRPVFAGGVAILLSAFEVLQIKSVNPSEGALREGLLYDLLNRIHRKDIRDSTVQAVSERYHLDRHHAKHVKATAIGLLEQIEEPWELLQRESRNLISWGADLHELGLSVSHSHYHKHGQYLVSHSDMMGFSDDERNELAILIRAHRRKFPVQELAALNDGGIIEKLARLLRLAVILNRSRDPRPAIVPEITVKGARLALKFPETWLKRNPLTRADLAQESDYQQSAGYDLEYV